MEFNQFPTDYLAAQCAEESSKKQQAGRDDRFCFELVRRAFGLDDHVALGYALDIYKDVWSRFWVRDAYVFESKHLTVDDFKSIAFMRVYERCRGEAFNGFSSLTPLLKYFKVTLVRTIAQFIRDAKRQPYTSISDPNEAEYLENFPSKEHTEYDKNLIRQAVEKRVAVLLPDKNDQLLFDCSTKQNFGPKEIVAHYSAIWENENTARVALQRIRRRVYKDAVLNDLLRELLD